MFPININPQDPFSLILVNDSHHSKDNMAFENTWEIQYEGGELGGISLYSTLGLQASSLRITPIFSNHNENKINLKQFKHSPIITEILPNYTNILVEVFPEIYYNLEYFVPDSKTIFGQVSIKNTSSRKFKGELQYYVSLKPLSAGEQMKGTQVDSHYLLTGKTKDLYPVFWMSGHAQNGKMGQPSIVCNLEIESEKSEKINWCLAFDQSKSKSTQRINEYQNTEFDKVVTRNKLSLQRDYFFFDTGNAEWDKTLLASQNSASQLLVASTEETQKISVVQSRHPEKTLFQTNNRDKNHHEGVTPLQLWYFIQVLPKHINHIQPSFELFLDAQREDGFIPNHSGPSNFQARFHAFPLLATIANEIINFQGTKDLAESYLGKIILYLKYWLKVSPEDASPHWENAYQSQYEDLPILNLWATDGVGINSQWIESPFLNSLLVLECEKCLQIADQFKIIFPEKPWLEEQRRSLVKKIEDSWNPKQKYYAYRDIQTRKTPAKQTILKSKKAGEHQLNKKLRSPQRLSVLVTTPADFSRKVTIEIKGKHENQILIETVMPTNFNWSTTSGAYTTINIFDQIQSIAIFGLPEEGSVQISTSQFSMVDLSLFMPLRISDINQKRSAETITHWLTREFLGDFGLPLVPKKFQKKGKNHLNWVDLPLNTMILEGLIEQQQSDLAKIIFSYLMKAVIKNLRFSKKFFKLYDANDGTCTGEYNIINGMIPLKLLFRFVGIYRWTDNEIEFKGASLFKNEISIFYRGLRIICSQKGHTLITSGGKIIELKTRNYHKVNITS